MSTRTSIRLASVLILVLALLPFSAHAREWVSWCGTDAEAKGWHFYCDRAEEDLPHTLVNTTFLVALEIGSRGGERMTIETAKKISSERFKIFDKVLKESKLHGSSLGRFRQ